MSQSVSGVSVMNQHAVGLSASASQAARTPLAQEGLERPNSKEAITRVISRAPAGSGAATARLVEGPVTGLLVLRAGHASAELATALRSVLQIELPGRLASQAQGDHYCIRWMSPDEWLLSCPLQEAFDIEKRLRKDIQGPVAIVNVSGGFCLLTLKGRDALNVLKKSTGYDVHPHNFAAGKVVNTMLAKAQVTLRAVDSDEYEIIVRRSFADYLWLWLQRAGAEYQMEVAATIA